MNLEETKWITILLGRGVWIMSQHIRIRFNLAQHQHDQVDNHGKLYFIYKYILSLVCFAATSDLNPLNILIFRT